MGIYLWNCGLCFMSHASSLHANKELHLSFGRYDRWKAQLSPSSLRVRLSAFIRAANNCSSSRPSYFETFNTPSGINRRLSQLTKTGPGDLLEPLVHMVTPRGRREDGSRKRRPLSALICHLPRGVLANEADLAIRVEEPVDLHEEAANEFVFFRRPHAENMISGERKAFPCKFPSGGVKCNWLPSLSDTTDFRLDRKLFKPKRSLGLFRDERDGLLLHELIVPPVDENRLNGELVIITLEYLEPYISPLLKKPSEVRSLRC